MRNEEVNENAVRTCTDWILRFPVSFLLFFTRRILREAL